MPPFSPPDGAGRGRPNRQKNAGSRVERPGGAPARGREVVRLLGQEDSPGAAPIHHRAFLPEAAAAELGRGSVDGGRHHGRDGGAGRTGGFGVGRW